MLEWYLNQIQHELVSLEAFERIKKTISQVIRRMIKHDGIVIVVEEAEAAADVSNEQKLLRLHPSYEP